MSEIKIVERRPMDVRVLTGTMPLYGQLLGSEGGTDSFSYTSRRATWSWLRLHMGKKRADDTIKALKDRLLEAVKIGRIEIADLQRVIDSRLRDLMLEENTDRVIQYILRENRLIAVASTEHLLISPSDVIDKAKRILEGATYQTDMGSVVAEIEQVEGLSLSFQIDPGDIVTRKAIRVGFGIRVASCFNPLTFLYTGGFARFFGPDWSRYNEKRNRVLRYDHPKDLDERIREAYEASLEDVATVKDDIARSKTVDLKLDDARVLGAAFPVAFGSGEKVVKQIWNRYNSEDSTIWGLAMAASYIARHGKTRRNSPKVQRSLAGAAAGYLFIRNVDEVVRRCSKWLKDVKKINLRDWM